MQKFPYIGLVLSCLSVICTLISFIPRYWVYYEELSGNQVTKVWLGMWQYCTSTGILDSADNQVCYYHYENGYPADKVFMGVTQTLMCQALITQVVSLVFSFMKLAIIQNKKDVFPIIIGLSIISGILLIIAGIVFAARVNDIDPSGAIKYSSSLHFAFAFAVVSALASIAAAVFTHLETTRK